ncbi:acyl-CoA dehydrogenase family protein [Hoeflea sp. G2-23]|uniref:Acyl-CoA dehydrogenase family protein n=1 Tax=Hoeflea algicola TaxID=2983763 RepID=A0ABT3ZD79_9HYPH|nr:acyl-CoA dehydrogenase family protein [Hoeflea algicola]MCY0149254.1 acyl-CoA dehydrogenase family protein [Hoeflea algicola]
MGLSPEQLENVRMLRESAAAVADKQDLTRIRSQRFALPGFDRQVWQTMSELGWLGLALPEANGGAGLGMVEMAALAEELGAALSPEPFIAATLAVNLLGPELRSAAMAGEIIILPALQEKPQDLGRSGDLTRFEDGRVSGRKVFVPMAAGADAFVVSTRGGLAVVDAKADGVLVETIQAQDGGHWGTVSFSGALATPTEGDLAGALDQAIIATSAYLLGVIDAALELTLDYLNTREQFGAKLGSFQALQHRAVDLKLQAALTRASVTDAASILDADTTRAAKSAAASRAKARASDAAMLVTRQAIQLHGGIGYTDEHDIGLFLRKAMVLSPWLGDSTWHRRRFAALTAEHDEQASSPARSGQLADAEVQ